MKKTFQSFVFGCRVNEAERIRFDSELKKAGFTVDLNTPEYCIVNTCAITGKAEREAKQLMYRLRKDYPGTKVVITGCSATYWAQKFPEYAKLADLVIPNSQKGKLASILAQTGTLAVSSLNNQHNEPIIDKFRRSNRLLVKIQDGCHRFCNYCIVPYLRGTPQSQRTDEVVAYINSFHPTPSEVVLSAINTESFGKDTGESLVLLIQRVLKETNVRRVGFGSVHPWSLTDEFLRYYESTLATEPRFVQFFHIPLQSGSQETLDLMRREYLLTDILQRIQRIHSANKNALLATDIIVGYLGETPEQFNKTYETLKHSPLSRFHIFAFSNRTHTSAYYMKRRIFEPTAQEKKGRSSLLRKLSEDKYKAFVDSQIGQETDALVISKTKSGCRVLSQNNIEFFVRKDALPGDIVHVTIED